MLALTALLVVLPSRTGHAARGPDFPDGFVDEVVVGDLDSPIAFSFLPDGRILIAERAGTVRLYRDGALLPEPFVDLRDRVDARVTRGIYGMAVDPDFAENGQVYLYYVYQHDPLATPDNRTVRLTRVTASGDTAAPESEVVLLGSVSGTSCPDDPAQADCLPADGYMHFGGGMAFAADGSLFVSTGDGGGELDSVLHAQDLDHLAGKVLRITHDGNGLDTNPFYTGDPDAVRSKVWAYGFRNPFRLALNPANGLPYVGSVGEALWDEVEVATPGANLGWPCYEGIEPEPSHADAPECQALYQQGPGAVRWPLLSLAHKVAHATIAGAFYTGSAFPAPYQGAFFYGDWQNGVIRSLHVDAENRLIDGPDEFGTKVESPVAIGMGPDEALYYLSYDKGELHRVRYAEPGDGNPPAKAPEQPRDTFLGAYFDNDSLAGEPKAWRHETVIDSAWHPGAAGSWSAGPDVSARWTGRHSFEGAGYQFTALVTGGIRAWLDDEPLLDAWTDQVGVTHQVARTVAEGDHDVRVEYYARGGDARVQFYWERQPDPEAPTDGDGTLGG